MSIKSNVMKTNEGSEKSEKNSILSVSIMGARDETLRLSECGFESMDDEAGLLPEGMKGRRAVGPFYLGVRPPPIGYSTFNRL